jgi:enterochelin esterase family protein
MKRLATILTFALMFFGLQVWPVASATDSSALSSTRVQTNSEIESPRIAKLRKEIEAGGRDALEQFWKDAAAAGTPLVEPVPPDERNVMVTFLWRAREETRNVVVFASLNRGNIAKNQMRRLLDTDLWYKTYQLPGDARFNYMLSPNDSLVPIEDLEEKDIPARTATLKIDPLNKRGAFGGGSILELPGASPQPWAMRNPDVPKGALENVKLKSEILKNERRAWVYTPPGYSRDAKPYGLIVLFDGPIYTLLIPTANILDNLLAKSKLPPMVALILDNPTATSRATEFDCY